MSATIPANAPASSPCLRNPITPTALIVAGTVLAAMAPFLHILAGVGTIGTVSVLTSGLILAITGIVLSCRNKSASLTKERTPTLKPAPAMVPPFTTETWKITPEYAWLLEEALEQHRNEEHLHPEARASSPQLSQNTSTQDTVQSASTPTPQAVETPAPELAASVAQETTDTLNQSDSLELSQNTITQDMVQSAETAPELTAPTAQDTAKVSLDALDLHGHVVETQPGNTGSLTPKAGASSPKDVSVTEASVERESEAAANPVANTPAEENSVVEETSTEKELDVQAIVANLVEEVVDQQQQASKTNNE